MSRIRRWDSDHAEEGDFFLLRRRRQVQLPSNELVRLLSTMLIKDDLIHRLCEVDIHLIEESGSVG